MYKLRLFVIFTTIVSSSGIKKFYMDSLHDCSYIEPLTVLRNETIKIYAKTSGVDMSRQGSCSINFKAVDTVQKEDAKLRVEFRKFNILDCSVRLQLYSAKSLLRKEYSCGAKPTPYITNGRDLYVSLYKANPDSTKYDFTLYITQDNLKPLPTETPPPDVLVIVVAIIGGGICLALLGGGVYLSVRNYCSKSEDWNTRYKYKIKCCCCKTDYCGAELGNTYGGRNGYLTARQRSYSESEHSIGEMERSFEQNEHSSDERENGYDERRHSHDETEREGQYDERGDSYDQRRYSNDEREDSYDDRRHSYDEREDNYDSRYSNDERKDSYDMRHSYDEREDNYDDRRHSYDERENNYDKRRYSNDEQTSCDDGSTLV